MNAEQHNVQPQQAHDERLVWQRPEVRTISAGSAEGASGAGNDNVVFS